MWHSSRPIRLSIYNLHYPGTSNVHLVYEWHSELSQAVLVRPEWCVRVSCVQLRCQARVRVVFRERTASLLPKVHPQRGSLHKDQRALPPRSPIRLPFEGHPSTEGCAASSGHDPICRSHSPPDRSRSGAVGVWFSFIVTPGWDEGGLRSANDRVRANINEDLLICCPIASAFDDKACAWCDMSCPHALSTFVI